MILRTHVTTLPRKDTRVNTLRHDEDTRVNDLPRVNTLRRNEAGRLIGGHNRSQDKQQPGKILPGISPMHADLGTHWRAQRKAVDAYLRKITTHGFYVQ